MADGAQVDDTGGMAALQVALAHLSTLISGSDAMDAKATFIVALNIALFGVFFGGVLATSGPSADPQWAAVAAPGCATYVVLLVGAWTVRPREFDQFTHPRAMLELHMTGAFRSDQLAWSYVKSIATASETVSAVLDEKSSGVSWLAVLTVLNLAAMMISIAAWLA